MDSIIEKYNLQLQREKEELMAQYEGQMKENTEKIKQQKGKDKNKNYKIKTLKKENAKLKRNIKEFFIIN